MIAKSVIAFIMCMPPLVIAVVVRLVGVLFIAAIANYAIFAVAVVTVRVQKRRAWLQYQQSCWRQ